MALTHTQIVNFKPRAKSYKEFDGQGLYIEVLPSGVKSFRIKYRIDKKEQRLVVGTFPAVTLQQAREKLLEVKKLLAQGINPSVVKKATKAARIEATHNSFEAVAQEFLRKNEKRWSKKYAKLITTRLTKYAFPSIGALPVSEIEAPTILTALRKLEERDVLVTANRVKQAIGQVIRYAIASGRAKYDPVPSLKGALITRPTKHHASVVDPKRVGEILRMFDDFSGTHTVKTALLLAPLLFGRPGELRQMEWAHLDLENGIWALPSSSMKMGRSHIVPLSTQAIALIKEMEQHSGHLKYVFPGARDPKRAMSDAAINVALRSLGINTKEELTGHGFRAMARTILRERLRFDSEVLECQISHAKKGSLGEAYDRTLHLEERVRMMQAWSDYLDDLKAGGQVIRPPIAG